MKRAIGVLIVAALIAVFAAACNKDGGNEAAFDEKSEIKVISREDGSGTRGAFVELVGIEEKDSEGNKKDRTTKEAIIAKQTDVMMTNVSGDKYGIGYISLGCLNDTVKAIEIDGVEISAENVKNESYPIARPFLVATKGEPAGVARDFMNFILSKEGQAVVAESYIAVTEDAASFTSDKSSGQITVAGSSSVSPLMEKLKEAYEGLNPNGKIEIQMLDSSAGMTGAIDGNCDIGMSSRELKDSEKEKLTPTRIATDGIAVIVNKENPITGLTKDQVRQIFMGEVTKWNEAAE